eukprot:CAMPEP_0198256696 /NCGR_PEP_ID=MMETSP1447-20131203/6540_1 /TAXON_ID=420782 /ORGANISM="Chaetoceros dichaeta, Strain CCMP1751" /LENGTH=457 /DNA_ID=CAMNT_0043943393 /DNA_START=80 /DNA_END=1450 /DNA_ORIENTATION=+
MSNFKSTAVPNTTKNIVSSTDASLTATAADNFFSSSDHDGNVSRQAKKDDIPHLNHALKVSTKIISSSGDEDQYDNKDLCVEEEDTYAGSESESDSYIDGVRTIDSQDFIEIEDIVEDVDSISDFSIQSNATSIDESHGDGEEEMTQEWDVVSNVGSVKSVDTFTTTTSEPKMPLPSPYRYPDIQCEHDLTPTRNQSCDDIVKEGEGTEKNLQDSSPPRLGPHKAMRPISPGEVTLSSGITMSGDDTATGGSNTTTTSPTMKHPSGSRGNINSSSPNNVVNAVEIANDLERRQKEVGLFSEMANSGTGFDTSPDDSADRHTSSGSGSYHDGSTRSATTNGDDAADQRKKEMNAFLALFTVVQGDVTNVQEFKDSDPLSPPSTLKVSENDIIGTSPHSLPPISGFTTPPPFPPRQFPPPIKRYGSHDSEFYNQTVEAHNIENRDTHQNVPLYESNMVT